ncbi:hypothetical protein BKI52_06800 [marine bacterium AO1-C]|nr:hypothetical protein BKI52_06800 [marine bacterium AO1-C]
MSKLAKQLIEENLRTKDPYLDLGNCGLDGTEAILDRLAECEHLETLIFSNVWWDGTGGYTTGKHFVLRQVPAHLPTQLKKLVLAGNQIQQIENLEQLKQLNFLDLSHNQISNIENLDQLKQLSYLDLSYNQITKIKNLEQLSQLKQLQLHKNQITKIENLGPLQQLTELNLSENRNTAVIKQVAYFKQLEKVDLSDNQVFHSLIRLSGLRKLKKLRKLYLAIDFHLTLEDLELENLVVKYIENEDFTSENRLKISNLNNLKELNLEGQGINKFILKGNYPKLKTLSLEKTYNLNIKEIIENIAMHTKVTNLTLNDLHFEYLPFEVFRMTQLEVLSLNNTPIKDLPKHSNLTQLKRLSLSGCKALKTIPQDLHNLEELDISNGCVPQGLMGLLQKNQQLKYLDIGNNAYPYIPELPNLEYLNLSKARVQTVSFLRNLTKLRELHLGNNQIKDLTPLLKLENLEVLDVSINKVKSFPISLVKHSLNLRELYLEGNPIENLPERKPNNVIEAIRNYIQALEEDEVIPNDQVKVLLLGNSTTGKSTLIEYLTSQNFTEAQLSTHGIKHIIWKPFAQLKDATDEERNIKVAIWDFGGQEFYHATHSLFFSNKALYLILFDQKTNFQGIKDTWIYLYENSQKVQKEVPLEHFHYHYWLDNVLHYNNQPDILLIQNKCDISEAIEIPTATKNAYSLSSNKHIFYISVKDAFHKQDKGDFQVFRNKLLDHIRNNIGKFENSKRWQEIKNKVQSEWAAENVLSFDQYVIRCQGIKPNIHDKKTPDEQSQLDTLTEMLHEQGVLLHFPDISELKNDVYVNPAWLTDCIYKVLDYSVIKNKGRFDFSHIKKIAQNIVGINTHKLLALLKHFKLIFEIQRFGKQFFITPQYLPEKFDEEIQLAIDTFKDTSKPKPCFVLSYPDFLPVSVFLKFLAIYGNLHKQHWYNKNELVFIKDDQVIVAKCTRNQDIRQISIEISGKHSKLTQEMFDALYAIDSSENLKASIDGKVFTSIEEIRNPTYRSFYQKDFWFILGESPKINSKFKDILEALQEGQLEQAVDSVIPHVLENEGLTIKLFQTKKNLIDANKLLEDNQEKSLMRSQVVESLKEILDELENSSLGNETWVSKEEKEINPIQIIENAMFCLKEAEYSGYFEEMDKIKIDLTNPTLYSSFKQKFMSGNMDELFAQRLYTFTKAALEDLRNK